MISDSIPKVCSSNSTHHRPPFFRLTQRASSCAAGSGRQWSRAAPRTAFPLAVLLAPWTVKASHIFCDLPLQELVSGDKEPITPFICRLPALAASGVSCVLVIGGSGQYFDVAGERVHPALSSRGWPDGWALEAVATAFAHAVDESTQAPCDDVRWWWPSRTGGKCWQPSQKGCRPLPCPPCRHGHLHGLIRACRRDRGGAGHFPETCRARRAPAAAGGVWGGDAAHAALRWVWVHAGSPWSQ